MTSKPIPEWLEDLCDAYRGRALANYNPDYLRGFRPTNAESSLASAIHWAFHWGSTPEGHAYWCDIEVIATRDPQSICREHGTLVYDF